MKPSFGSIDVRGLPEVIWHCRKEMAKLLRREADTEASTYVRERLRKIADMFEAGQGTDGL